MGTGTQNEPLGEPRHIHLTVKNTFIDAGGDDDDLNDDHSFEAALRRMVSEPVPERQYSGNAALYKQIAAVTSVKEAHGEEEAAEQESLAAASSAAAASTKPTPNQEPKVHVKNTFIDISDPPMDDGFEAGVQEILRARQHSEPIFQRQLSNSLAAYQMQMATAPAVPEEIPVEEIEEILHAVNMGKELQEEPETEIEPQMQPAVSEQEWANYFAQQGLMDFSGGFGSQSLQWQGGEFYPTMPGPLPDKEEERTRTTIPIPPEWDNIYTVMMRNLPNRYTQRMLLDEICNGGFMGTFDFLYLPIDPDTNANKGYGFINFLEPAHAWQFKCTYEGKQMSRFNSSKFVSVSPAALQGLEANHAHYSTSRCSRGDPAARPLFLREPQQTMAARPGGRGSRRGGRRRLQDASLVDIAARQAKQVAAGPVPSKPEAKAVPSGQMFGLGKTTPPSRGGGAQSAQGGKAAAAGDEAKFCPFCGGACKPEFRFCQFCGACLDVLKAL